MSREHLMIKKKLIIVVAVIFLLLLVGIWLRQQLDIDHCLDQGGRWNYDAGMCEGANTQQ